MRKKKFLLALTLGWVFSQIGVVLSFATRSQLPEALQTYIATRHNSISLTTALLWLALWLPLVGAFITSIVGIYFWRAWARLLYSITLVAGYVLLLPLGNQPSVHTTWVEGASGLSSICAGIVLCAMWCVPEIKELFQKRPSA